jgi:hypothetical protein
MSARCVLMKVQSSSLKDQEGYHCSQSTEVQMEHRGRARCAQAS